MSYREITRWPHVSPVLFSWTAIFIRTRRDKCRRSHKQIYDFDHLQRVSLALQKETSIREVWREKINNVNVIVNSIWNRLVGFTSLKIKYNSISRGRGGKQANSYKRNENSPLIVQRFADWFLLKAVHIRETHACSPRRHMAMLQQVAVKTSLAPMCAYIGTCVRTDIVHVTWRLLFAEVVCKKVSYTSPHRFPIQKLHSCRDRSLFSAGFLFGAILKHTHTEKGRVVIRDFINSA